MGEEGDIGYNLQSLERDTLRNEGRAIHHQVAKSPWVRWVDSKEPERTASKTWEFQRGVILPWRWRTSGAWESSRIRSQEVGLLRDLFRSVIAPKTTLRKEESRKPEDRPPTKKKEGREKEISQGDVLWFEVGRERRGLWKQGVESKNKRRLLMLGPRCRTVGKLESGVVRSTRGYRDPVGTDVG